MSSRRPKEQRYGTWKSPQSAHDAVAAGIGIGETAFDGDAALWLEARPSERGRNVVVRRHADGRIDDLIAAPFDARSRVHEYGGGAWLMAQGTLYFSNFSDQRVYRATGNRPPQPITPEAALRYADFCHDRRRSLLWCVREDHRGSGEAQNTIVALRCDGELDAGRVVVSGHDFVAAPRLSPDGRQLAWLGWNHPDMPWDGCELWLANVNDDGTLHGARHIAGGRDEAVQQPRWCDDGTLYFVSDRSGWWNLYRLRGGYVQPLCPMQAEFGAPPWLLGSSSWAFVGVRQLVCTFAQQGLSRLASLDLQTLKFEIIDSPFSVIHSLSAHGDAVLFCAASPLRQASVYRLDMAGRQIDMLRSGSSIAVDAGYTSVAEAIEFPTRGGQTAHAFFYAPRNRDIVAAPGKKPPLLVMSHGGPTSMAGNDYKTGIQYWTSRGFAVLDVNYRGSSGFGRAYRQALDGQWGVADVDDCIHGAQFLVRRGDVDAKRLAIRGGSAGGYTTLCALAFHRVFHSGCSRYGIGDLQALLHDTHKFESRYLDRLIGPWPAASALYADRSPIHHLQGLNCPLILLQGAEDKVVPPAQSRQMHAALQAKGVPVAYIEFAGEQHGFRQAKNIVRALEAEAWFHARIFGFELADSIEPVQVDNLP